METAYSIDGRCDSGDLLRIRVPCWRMVRADRRAGEKRRSSRRRTWPASVPPRSPPTQPASLARIEPADPEPSVTIGAPAAARSSSGDERAATAVAEPDTAADTPVVEWLRAMPEVKNGDAPANP